ncbi:hypothetical protein CS542_10020 [Pedobacter sp. IW39]|nr:hypothetical protein CS542_10020 [Pedobacter sp. IW39]
MDTFSRKISELTTFVPQNNFTDHPQLHLLIFNRSGSNILLDSIISQNHFIKTAEFQNSRTLKIQKSF